MGTESVADRSPPCESHAAISNEAPSASAIWERICLRLEERLGVVERHAHRLLDRGVTSQEGIAAASSLASELGRLELPGIARLARHLVTTLNRDRLDAGDAVHIAGTTDDIRTLLSSAIAQQESTAASRGTIAVVGPASAELDGICWTLASRGHDVMHDADRLVDLPTPPAGVLVSVASFTTGTHQLMQAICESWPVPIIALYQDANPETLRALAAQCSTILPLTASPDVVRSEFGRYEIAEEVSPVFYVHGQVPRATAQMLRAHGFRLQRAPRINDLPGLLQEGHAAVIFGDTAAPADVVAVTRVIRAIPATRRAPIVWLAPHPPEQQEQARRLDIAPVDTVTEGIAARTKALLHATEADRMEEEQAIGSVLTWSAARVLTDRSLVAAHRAGTSVVVAVVAIDSNISDEQRAHTLESLGREFRRGDIVGLRDDRTVVVTLQGVSRRVATNRLSELVDRFDLDDGSGRAGFAMFPADGRSANELVEAALAAREMAIASDGPPVVSTTWRPVSQQVAEVLIVESDPALGQVLASVIAARGHRTDVLDNGNAAFEWMTDPNRTELPRLLLADLDTPGLDGLSLVRRLRRAGALAHVSVLLMTARTSESDLRVAFDLGVKEVISKPFSGTLLLHRVGRLLEDQ